MDCRKGASVKVALAVSVEPDLALKSCRHVIGGKQWWVIDAAMLAGLVFCEAMSYDDVDERICQSNLLIHLSCWWTHKFCRHIH